MLWLDVLVLAVPPSMALTGCKAVVDLVAAGCAEQVFLLVEDPLKEAPTQVGAQAERLPVAHVPLHRCSR